jgi:hypothetical protein
VRQRELNSGKTPAFPQVEVVQRAGLDPYKDLARTGIRIRSVFIAQFLDASVLVKSNGLHRSSLQKVLIKIYSNKSENANTETIEMAESQSIEILGVLVSSW